MRVVRTEGSDRADWVPRLCDHRGQPYAILSHRWLQDPNHEVVFADIEEIGETVYKKASNAFTVPIKNPQYTLGGVAPNSKPGFKKLQGAARRAVKDGYEFLWVDTCCINKSSSSELSEAINSMWKWYKVSSICYVYFSSMPDVPSEAQKMHFAANAWWRRGWLVS